MGILARFSEIMKANINALLDKAEDPGKMADQLLRNLREELAEVKSETAAVMANEKRAGRAVEEREAEIEKYDRSARNALRSGNEEDARALLLRKNELEAGLPDLKANHEAAVETSKKLKGMHNKLIADIRNMEVRISTVKAKMATARAQDSVNRAKEYAGSKNNTEAFDPLEQRANQMLDQAQARAELAEETSSISDLANKYASGGSADVEEELQKLKEELGLS